MNILPIKQINSSNLAFGQFRTRFYDYEKKPFFQINNALFKEKEVILKKKTGIVEFAKFLDEKGYDLVAFINRKFFEFSLKSESGDPYKALYDWGDLLYYKFAVNKKTYEHGLVPSYVWDFEKRVSGNEFRINGEKEANNVLNAIENKSENIIGKFAKDDDCPKPYFDEIQKNYDLVKFIDEITREGGNVKLKFETLGRKLSIDSGFSYPTNRLYLEFENRTYPSCLEDYSGVKLILAQNKSKLGLIEDIKNIDIKKLRQVIAEIKPIGLAYNTWNSYFPEYIENTKPYPDIKWNSYDDFDTRIKLSRQYTQLVKEYRAEARNERNVDDRAWFEFMKNYNNHDD